jgi:hypothetical protein
MILVAKQKSADFPAVKGNPRSFGATLKFLLFLP